MKIARYRIRTGQYDADGEQCLLCIGGEAIEDGDYLWITNPNGERMFRIEKNKVEVLSEKEAIEVIKIGSELIQKHRRAKNN